MDSNPRCEFWNCMENWISMSRYTLDHSVYIRRKQWDIIGNRYY